jgi:hypothetical protein
MGVLSYTVPRSPAVVYPPTPYVPAELGPAPYSPTIQTLVDAGSHTFTVTWYAPFENADGSSPVALTANTVYWGATQGQQQNGGSFSGSAAVSAGALSYTGASGAGTWWVAVSASNANGESWSSPEVSVVVA